MSQRKYLVLLCLFCVISSNARSQKGADVLFTSEHFSFHNNMWMNLHHFLYEKASNQQTEKALQDGTPLKDIGDNLEISQLSDNDRSAFEDGIEFYRDNVIEQPLIASRRLLKWLQSQSPDRWITDTTYSQAFTVILNQLYPVYKNHFWQRHSDINSDLVTDYIDFIKSTETEVITKMEALSGMSWEGIVRVDITTYGNWAGAYSPDWDNIASKHADHHSDRIVFWLDI